MVLVDSTDSDTPRTTIVLKKILEHTIEGIAIIGEDRTIEYVNTRVCEILGRSQDELLGQSFLEFIHPESSDLVLERYGDRLEGELNPTSYEIQVLRNNNEPRTLRLSSSVLTNGENKIKILAQVLDVTEERRTQNSLSNYAMKYSTLIETMNEGLGVIDDKGILVHANASLCRMLEYTDKELVGKETSEIMQGYSFDTVFEKIKKRMSGQSSRYETFLAHRSGRLIPTMVSASPLFNEDGEYKGSFAIFTDVSKQKVIEKDLQAARDRSLLYLDLMSHDVRNHLQEIQVAAELLQYGVDTPSVPDLLEHILQAVSKSTRIISESRTIDALDELPLKERFLDKTLKDTVIAAILLHDDVDFRMSIQVSDVLIKADDYLEILLSDLLSDACKRSLEDEKRVWIALKEETTVYELVVSDNGPIRSEDLKSDLFDTEQRLRGLQLHLARYIIDKYSGSIEVFDRISEDSGRGLSIKVKFPKPLH